ncbi:MAG: SAM-dependent chlorinase/fluorinase [Bryobacterales bacterium]|nr:SAM-dependent chlorinase/fluorinase [Bryobacterales bacterium]
MGSEIVTLTTDFGHEDHYVGVMKGVIAGIHPPARIIDLTHDVGPYGLLKAAFVIAQAHPFFPAETVHVVVVDPGVGTSRRPILVEAAGQHFVAPDNGVLSQVYEQTEHLVREIDAERWALKPTSNTFHGRDLFAPVAAWLAKGTPPAAFGSLVDEYVQLDPTTPALAQPGRWHGKVLNIDRFGNIVTSFPAELLEESPSDFRLAAGGIEVSKTAKAYAQAPPGAAFVITGSSGYLEVSINRESAAERGGVAIGDDVELVFRKDGRSRPLR